MQPLDTLSWRHSKFMNSFGSMCVHLFDSRLREGDYMRNCRAGLTRMLYVSMSASVPFCVVLA
ncbi:hypothetical protein ARMSODRAFT_955917 [Armillaria solidipes]|uniref:Uncharacterized protein n=1 Tax=Armillaria solidipes TaxID=1076256 RepID=A0A2H3BTU3_9AGAR|nr:hypothetical protein ARMSODRAFT_955917 [Armillaria solidipes]